MSPSFFAFSDELRKIAEVVTKLLPHQQRVVDRLKRDDQTGLVAVHGLGSGKTLTAIAAQDALQMPATVVVPAALQANFRKEQEKHLEGDPPKTQITTMQAVARRGAPAPAPLLVVDEAHRARESGSKTYQALKRTEAEKRLLLTGSPFYNHPADIAPLINLAAGEDVLPSSKTTFEKHYITRREIDPGIGARLQGAEPGIIEELNKAKAHELRDVFSKYVDYHPGSREEFPNVTYKDVRVPMTPEQLRVYDSLIDKAPPWVAAKVRAGLPPSKQESQQLNAFLSAARQAANNTAPFQTEGEAHHPKIDHAFTQLQKKLQAEQAAKAVVYSNYLDAGIAPYKEHLERAKIPYGEFTGEMDQQKRDELVRQYNENKIRALLLSSAGGEGLDLKGTRLIQVLEPHWNEEKLRQVIGRGVRYKSHEGLPEDQQNVEVQRYYATRPASGALERLGLREPGKAVDEYLSARAQEKERLLGQFRQLLPREA